MPHLKISQIRVYFQGLPKICTFSAARDSGDVLVMPFWLPVLSLLFGFAAVTDVGQHHHHSDQNRGGKYSRLHYFANFFNSGITD
jgi:hypothetical protein